MNDKNKEQIMDELFVLASKFSKIVSKSGLCNIWGEVNKIQEDQIKYFLLQEYYFAAPYGFDQYAFSWALLDKRTNELDKQLHDLIKDYNYRNIDDPDNKNQKSFFDLNPIAQNYVFNGLGEKEINDIIYAIDFGNLDLFYKLSPNVQKKLLALDSCLAQKISNRNEYRNSEFKGHAAEEVQKNIDNCCGFYKFEQNLYRQKDEIYNDSVVSDGAWKYFYEEDAKGVINEILSVDPKEIDKLLGLDLETSHGESSGVEGKRIKIKDALAMIVEMFPSLFFKLPIEIQDKILDHKYEKGSRSVRESVRSYVEVSRSLYNFLPVVTENFLTEDEKKWKKEIEEPYKINKQNDPNSEKKENPVEKTKPSDNQEAKPENDPEKEITNKNPEGNEKQKPVEKPDQKDYKQEITDESETETETKDEDDIKKEITNKKPEGREKQEPVEKPDQKDYKHENIDVPETETETKDKDDIKKEITNKKPEGREKQEPVEKPDQNKITLSQEEANNKIKNIISQVDKFIGLEKDVFSLEEVKNVLKSAIELAYAVGRFDEYKQNKSECLEGVKNSDEITIRNFIAVFIAVLFDSKKSIFRKSDWRHTAFSKNITSVMKKLKGSEKKSRERYAPTTSGTTHKHNRFIGF